MAGKYIYVYESPPKDPLLDNAVGEILASISVLQSPLFWGPVPVCCHAWFEMRHEDLFLVEMENR